MVIDAPGICRWLAIAAAEVEARRDELTALDAAIGDADHGTNMSRGFGKLSATLPGLAGKSINEILKAAGMTLLSSVGGASGPLYGTFFLRAAQAAAEKRGLDAADVLGLLREGTEGIRQRGRAEPGDKTMLDALLPAVESFQAAVDAGADLAAALERAEQAAAEGVRATIPMVARKGRASYLGERSAGHADPGATSAHLLLRALRQAFC